MTHEQVRELSRTEYQANRPAPKAKFVTKYADYYLVQAQAYAFFVARATTATGVRMASHLAKKAAKAWEKKYTCEGCAEYKPLDADGLCASCKRLSGGR